jgi:hypothetical protein
MRGIQIRKINEQKQSTQVYGVLSMPYSGVVYENFDTLKH